MRVTLVAINGDTGFGIVEPVEGGENSVKNYIKGLRSSAAIKTVKITYASPEGYWTQVVHKLGTPSIHETILQSGCMTCLPIVIEGGIQNHVVLAPSREELRSLVLLLKERFSMVKIKRLRSTTVGLSRVALTEKQKQAFKLAYESGYYSIPRETTLSHVAESLGIKRVAMQERLRRVEQHVMTALAEETFQLS